MYYVKLFNAEGGLVVWSRHGERRLAENSRANLIEEHDFYPEDVIIEEQRPW